MKEQITLLNSQIKNLKTLLEEKRDVKKKANASSKQKEHLSKSSLFFSPERYQ